ncbi:hypothetical protein GIY56_03090 [Paracoccus sp. YIM 132242]|uniref:Uncharacterized protein n=1 Tax=Paracoccus lichenicola TaxID=2665644 RepID=A0A6L6HM15_9RHOB|nr:hypothetical protein [Paracoccus lichenicola]MTD99269.1 hypothetical protein [Paracoccus lichenicola]
MTREEKEKHFEEIMELLDETEKSVLLYTIVTVTNTKSKGWRTRRINDFTRWLDERRNTPIAEKVA